MHNLDKFIGLSFDDFDCWRLVRLYYQKMLSIELPDVDIQHREVNLIKDVVEIQAISEVWIKLDSPEKHCIVTMCTDPNIKSIHHLGVCVGENRLLHVQRGGTSYLDRLDNPIIISQTRGFYKWHTL